MEKNYGRDHVREGLINNELAVNSDYLSHAKKAEAFMGLTRKEMRMKKFTEGDVGYETPSVVPNKRDTVVRIFKDESESSDDHDFDPGKRNTKRAWEFALNESKNLPEGYERNPFHFYGKKHTKFTKVV